MSYLSSEKLVCRTWNESVNKFGVHMYFRPERQQTTYIQKETNAFFSTVEVENVNKKCLSLIRKKIGYNTIFSSDFVQKYNNIYCELDRGHKLAVLSFCNITRMVTPTTFII